MKPWILTAEVNEYDQYGDYFVAIFPDKPTAADLERFVPARLIDHVLAGGGRLGSDHEWYNLFEADFKNLYTEGEHFNRC